MNTKKKEILEAFQFRHACKLFDPTRKITPEDFDFILETARLSPSSFGFEPWHFVVVQDTKLGELLKEPSWGAVQKLETASHFVLCLTMKSSMMRYDTDYIRQFMLNVQQLPTETADGKLDAFKEFQQSDFDLNTDRALFDWASKQCYIALGNMMTAAALIGIDSCPIEGFDKQAVDEILRDKFGIDAQKYGISYMVAFGYRGKEPHPKTRRNISEVVSWM